MLDSNFLMIPASFKIDIFREIENLLCAKVIFATVPPVIDELKRISKKPTKLGKKAKLALNFASKCTILNSYSEKNPEGSVDDFIVSFTREKKVIVATTDINLKKKLRRISVPVIYLRGRKQIKLDGFIT